MSSRSRRKTLSHTEIENFLFDLSPDGNSLSSTSSTQSANSNVSSSTSSSDSSFKNLVPDLLSMDITPQNPVNLSNKVDDLRESIRRIYQHLLHSEVTTLPIEIKNQAKAILDDINYPILPKRILTPEAFQLPPNTVAAKKALLHSMTPMLTEGEHQRKIDTTKCEEFTRCRVEKNKIRASCYDYVDIDTNLRISGTEYTKRYMLFIQHSKQITPNNASYRTATDLSIDPFADETDLSSINMLNEAIKGHDERISSAKKTPLKDVTSESSQRNQSNQMLPFSVPPNDPESFWKDDFLGCGQNDDSENFFSLKSKKRERQAVSHVSSRRRTLSPTTSRNMLLEVLESEVETTPSTPDFLLQEPSKEKLSPEKVATAVSPSSTESSSPFAFDEEISQLVVENKEEGGSKNTLSVPPTRKIKEFALSSTKDDQYNREAMKKYKIRQEIARWKYSWEIVSNEAAMTALQYLLKISEE